MEEQVTASDPTFGPTKYGARLAINESMANVNAVPVVIDVETDEKDNFVGLAICGDPKTVCYYSDLSLVPSWINEVPLIGHNLKFDMKLLKKWGINVSSNRMFFDTCLASYVMNTTKDTHSLKDLAKEYLGYEWPTYKDMVGKGKKKVTLDKQEVGRVAAYCGMDTLATYQLYQYFMRKMNPQHRRILEYIELPVARALMDMELTGAMIDLPYLSTLDTQFQVKLTELEGKIRDQWFVIKGQDNKEDKPFNVNSNRQVAELLEAQGAILPTTEKGNKKVDKITLQQWINIPSVPLLLEYSKIEKLHSTYTQSLLSKQQEGRIHCDFNQISKNEQGADVGISTNRLSSSNPNLQNIPARSEEGKLIRRAFIAPKNQILIDADYSQIEYRLLAHFSKEPRLIQAFKDGKDVHEETGKALGCSRDIGKTLNFASIYGAQAAKISRTAKVSESDAEQFLNSYWKVLPRVTAWIHRVKFEARAKKGIFTLNRRWIPLPGIMSGNRFERMHWERAAVNYIIQGSAAEVMKLALIKLAEFGYKPILTVHDEFIFEHQQDYRPIEAAIADIKNIMESVVKLDVPLIADIGSGVNWQEAKGD
jgi:DNA polymerase-1